MSIGGVVLNFSAETKGAVKDISRLTRSLDHLGDESKSTSSVLKKVGKVGVAAVAAGAALGAVALVDMAKAAYADEQAAKKLDRILGRIPGTTDAVVASTRAWIDQMELATGIADDDLRGALGRLAVVTKDVTEAQKLTALAADASTASGKSYTSVVTAMAKAADGNTTALNRLFPQLDAGPDKVLTLQEAVDQLTKAYGGAASAAEDNDLFGRLGTIAGQLKESLGKVALPLLEELAAWFAEPANIAKVQGWIDKVGELATSLGVELVDKIKTNVIPFLRDELLPALEEVKDWFASPEGKDAIKTWGGYMVGLGDAIKVVTGYLGPMLELLAKIKKITDWIPSNVIVRALTGEFSGGGSAPKGVRDSVAAGGAYAPASGGRSGGVVNVTVNNGRQEPALDSAALALRLGRRAVA